MSPAVRVGATGFALVAVCYGFARFAYGLFLPAITAELALPPRTAGLIAGGSFVGYCIAIVAAAASTERFGPRPVALAAGLVATIGLVLIAVADGAVALAASVLFAGTSTGLASPPLAAAVTRRVAASRRDLTNTFVNAGTSVGGAFAGPAAILLGAHWRVAYATFAAVALLATLATAFGIDGGPGAERAPERGRTRMTPDLTRLVIAALLTGVASTAVWSFGGELVARNLGWEGRQTGLLWIVIGVAGIAGSVAGWLCGRFGTNAVHRVTIGCLAAAILMFGATPSPPALVVVGAALFGAAYIMLTGVYLVGGVSALPGRAASGLTIAFLAIAVGQSVGAPLFGAVLGLVGVDATVTGFGAIALVAALPRLPHGRTEAAVRAGSA